MSCVPFLVGRRRVLLALSFLLALLPSAPPRAERIALAGGRVHTMAGATHDPGFVLMDGATIVAVGDAAGLAAAAGGAAIDRTLDVTGLDVYPGWFAAHTQLGLVEIGAVPAVNDTSEGTAISTAQVRVIDAINPESSLMAVSRMTGVAVAAVAPGGRVITGQGAVVTLAGGRLDEVLVASPTALYVNFGEAGRTGESKSPQTRMGVMGVLREEFIAAQEYRAKWQRHDADLARWQARVDRHAARRAALLAEGKQQEADDLEEPGLAPLEPSRDLALDPLVSALDGDLLVVARAHRRDDIESALRLADEFGLRLALLGAADAWKMAEVLAARQVPVLLRATENPDAMETQGARYSAAARLHAAGVPFALIPEDDAHNVRNLPFEAGLAVTYGLPRAAALEAITIAPARIFGLEEQVGSLQPGRAAHVVVVEGDPLQPGSRVRHLFLGGREVSLTSRQTELAAPYLAAGGAR